jgi:putative aminopeptidase FrvX
MKETHLQILRSVLNRPTAPFREDRVVDLVHQLAARLDHVRFRRDPSGNVLLRYRKGEARVARPLALQAHLDHPGLHVVSQTRTGRVKARLLGWMPPDVLPGARVVFHGLDEVRAEVLSARPGREENEQRVTLAAEGRVDPDAIGTWDLPGCRFRGDHVAARVADDLAGVVAVLCAFDDLSRRAPDGEVLGVLTRAEEVRFAGATALARGGRLPKRCRVVTVECSQELPGAMRGGGPVLRVGDRFSVFSPDLSADLRETAQRLRREGGVRFQRALLDAAGCEATVFGAHGYEVAGLSLPIADVHNVTARGGIGPERFHAGDLEGLIDLLVAFATEEPTPDDRDRRARDRLWKRTAPWVAELDASERRDG